MKNFIGISIFSLVILFCPFYLYADGIPVDINGYKYLELRTPHFIIYYDRSVPEPYVSRLGEKAEIFYRRITEEFNFMRDNLWTWDNRAQIFVASDKDCFSSRFGCAAWSVACVDYQKKLIYSYYEQEGFDKTLAHEMCHIIIREYLGSAQMPLWFDEGMAQYIQEKYAESSHLDLMIPVVRRIVSARKYIGFDSLLTMDLGSLDKLNPEEVEIFYFQSLSVIDFLIKKYGRDIFSYFLFHLRNGDDFHTAFSLSFSQLATPKELEKRWISYYTE